MEVPDEAPPLPREPTILRVSPATIQTATTQNQQTEPILTTSIAPAAAPTLPSSPPPPKSSSTNSNAPKRPTRDLPLPPRFPSMKDVGTAWAVEANLTPDDSLSPPPDSLHDVAWMRSSTETIPASTSPPTNTDLEIEPDDDANLDTCLTSAAPTNPPENIEQKQGFVSKLMKIFKRSRPNATASSSISAPRVSPNTATISSTDNPRPPMLARAKALIYRLPDPTLAFVLEACVMLLLHAMYPHLLRTWVARLVVPAILVPTVAATALWRRTNVIAIPGRTVVNIVKPIPNATKIVARGERLRAKEASLLEAEDELRKGQLKLEMLRKEIEARLPPQISIVNLVEREGS